MKWRTTALVKRAIYYTISNLMSFQQLSKVSPEFNELSSTKDELQNTIEELESSNEELKASNEEIMSMNEELQSSNEELETSKEKLQSLNEELNTVNNELQDKIRILEATNNDITNLVSSTNIAAIFLDTQFFIKFYTPSAKKRFETILQKSEEKFSTIFHSNPIVMAISTLEGGVFLDVNNSFQEITEFSKEEVIGKSSVELGLWDWVTRRKYIAEVQQQGFLKNKEQPDHGHYQTKTNTSRFDESKKAG